ncbi:MAG: hypothetical protein IKQ69_04015 [Oscillospiraceae bacterium]|nr:hypothetical protein [Oscillospiraceae bacterium]
MTAEERKNTPPDLGDENTVFAEDNSDISWDTDPAKIKKSIIAIVDTAISNKGDIKEPKNTKKIARAGAKTIAMVYKAARIDISE